MSYTNFEIENLLKTINIIVDSREHPGKQFDERVKSFGCAWERRKLDQGDYSYKYTDLDGREISMDKRLIIERKMNLNEIANNFGRERQRFIREFERAKAENTQVYILIEDDSWEDAYKGTYGKDARHRSKYSAKAMIGSLTAWEHRYNARIRFCKKSRSGQMIKDICHYHLKEILENEG